MEDNPSAPKKRRIGSSKRLSGKAQLNLTASNDMCDSAVEPEEIIYAGRVVRLQMVNFMCHSNLEVHFNPRINFIAGRNGSGKSAVMAALVVVLGGTAMNTGRGTGVADFIKKGENSGRVTIELLNEGINAYKADVYGNRITIVRSFVRGGSNSYTIKSASGAVVSKKKMEVDKICEVLRLQIRNPVCVLNQDNARNFLASTDSKVRYKLFMSATQLQQLNQLHEDTIADITAAREEIERKHHLLDEAKKEVAESKKKLQYITTLKEVKKERRDLENELLWAGVIAEEQALEVLKEEKTVLEKKKEEFHSVLTNHQEMLSSLESQADDLKQTLDELVRKKQIIADQKRMAHAEVLRLQNEITKQETQLSFSLPKLERTVADISRVKEFIDQIDERNNQCTAEHARVSERMRVIQAELKENQERCIAAERDFENANETKVRTREEISQISETRKEMEINMNHKIQQLEGMKGQGDMDALRFGSYVPRLLQAIEESRHKFKRKPIGPLGMYVKLNCDTKWAPAVESVVGALMTSFCCDNNQDFRALARIMDEVVGKKHPSVIVSEFQGHRHDVSTHRAQVPGINTVLDVLSFADDTVFNTFIDQAGIEGVFLFERDDQAAGMLTHIENVPKGLRLGVTMACDRYYPAPNYRTYAGRAVTRFFNQSNKKEDVITKLEAEIAKLRGDVNNQKTQLITLRDTMSKMEDFSNRSRTRLRALREKREALQMELSQLKDQDDSRPVPRTRLALEEELETLERQKADCEAERSTKENALKKLSDSMQDSKTKLEGLIRTLDQWQEKITSVESELNSVQDAKNTQIYVHRNADAQLQRLQHELRDNSEKQVLQEVELQQRQQEAVGIHPERINTERSAAEISRLIQQKEQYLKAAGSLTGSEEEAMNLYKEKVQSLKEKMNNEKRITNDLSFFIHSINQRRRLFFEKRQYCAQEVGYNFRATLMTRNYDGRLTFDFDNEELELEVQPRGYDEPEQRTDARTLSGGERSYSTVSFILAIWGVIQMPFYFLDEFDVFMDKMNRQAVLDLLLLHAEENNNTQYVFITPQDISSIQSSEICTIYRMPDPERKRTAESPN